MFSQGLAGRSQADARRLRPLSENTLFAPKISDYSRRVEQKEFHMDAFSAMVALSVGCGSGFDPNPVIHSAVDALLASEVFLGCLHGNVPK
jgi:hypothetical protein